MQIHELNNFNGELGSSAYIPVDNGADTGKVSTTKFLAETKAEIAQLNSNLNARIDNIIAGGDAPSAAEIVDARLGIDGVAYPSLGDSIRDQVSDVKKAITDQIVPPVVTLEGFHIASSGKWAEDSRYDSDYFPVNGGDEITIFPSPNGTSYTMLKSLAPVNGGDPDYATGYSNVVAATGNPVTVPNDAKFCIYRIRENATDLKPTKIIYNEYPLFDKMYEIVVNNTKAAEKIEEVEETLSTIFNEHEPVNKYNGGYSVGYLNNDGSVNPTPGYTCSSFQTLKKGTYLFKFSGMFGTNAKHVYRYNEDETFIEFITGEDIGSSLCKFTLSTDSICKINIGDSSTPATWMIVEGETAGDYPNEYIPYFTPYIELDESVKVEGVNPLVGKKLCCDGDSIMYGAGYTGGFAKLIAENNSMTIENLAVSGATIRSGTTWGDSTNRHWICDSIANLDPDGDYFIFDGWINDANSQTVMGSISWGYDAVLDTATFCGAFEQCCKTLATTFAGKKVGYVFVHRIWKPTDTMAQSFIDNMIEILEKWGVPYINLMELDPPINEIAALKTAYTKDGDGWHPNEQGYKLFYVDKITAWLKTL